MTDDVVRIPVNIPSPEHCSVCTSRLREAVDALPGVGSVDVDPALSLLTVSIDKGGPAADELAAQVERLGFDIAQSVGHASWRLTGLDCPDCARTVAVSIERIDHVWSAALNFASGTLYVEYDSTMDPRSEIVDMVGRMDYGIESVGDTTGRPIAEFRLSGIDCPDCASKLQVRVNSLDGVGAATLDFNTAKLRVGYEPSHTSIETLRAAIEAAGYTVESVQGEPERDIAPKSWWRANRTEASTAMSGALIALGLLLGQFEVLSTFAFALAIAVGGAVVARRAVASARVHSLDMNVLMTIAVIGAAGIGEWLEGAMVVFLFSVGGLLESRSLARTRSSIRDLMDLTPALTRVIRDGNEFELPPSEVRMGDTVVVRPGGRIPLDGEVLSGSSAVDEAPITGESFPVDKVVGDAVYAGTLNTNGVLEVRVSSLSGDSTLARVIHLVEEAQAQQAPFQRMVDRFTRYYTPAVVVLAILISTIPPVLTSVTAMDLGGFGDWFYRALVLLVVSCPCALVISTPVAVVSAITRATHDGVLIKGGAFLELAPQIRAIAFDKTGTLTRGCPEVADMVAISAPDSERVLEVAAALERHSGHPLAGAVMRAVGETAVIAATDVRAIAGRGVTGTIDGKVFAVGNARFMQEGFALSDHVESEIERLENDGRTVLVVVDIDGREVLGLIGVSDAVRSNAAEIVRTLRESGVGHLVMLTGDNDRTAQAIARQVGLTEYRARLLPEDKTDAIRELKERYGRVAMVGDGINDAPALASADVGIAMGAAGADTALETADVALLGDDLRAIPAFLALGRRTVANIRQNVWVSIVVKLAVLIAAVLGFAPLWLAVFADTGVALLVILNALRLLRAAR
ncbi:MAG: heavy metal translocating P-type ATPase [Actinomycetota bacterium]|jgi:Cd2+/Zn2+-exporting ATPase|nr:heavy metal translocating P-type ATPase [Actinomycetota bacterium]